MISVHTSPSPNRLRIDTTLRYAPFVRICFAQYVHLGAFRFTGITIRVKHPSSALRCLVHEEMDKSRHQTVTVTILERNKVRLPSNHLPRNLSGSKYRYNIIYEPLFALLVCCAGLCAIFSVWANLTLNFNSFRWIFL